MGLECRDYWGRDWRRNWVVGWRSAAWGHGEGCSGDMSVMSTGC